MAATTQFIQPGERHVHTKTNQEHPPESKPHPKATLTPERVLQTVIVGRLHEFQRHSCGLDELDPFGIVLQSLPVQPQSLPPRLLFKEVGYAGVFQCYATTGLDLSEPTNVGIWAGFPASSEGGVP